MPKLSLADWGSLAEVVGAVGVIVSLGYVGIQVRDNTAEMRITNRQQLIGRAQEATQRFALSPELSSVLAKVASGATLTVVEAVQYGYLIRSMLYDVQEAFALNQEGRLDDAYWGTRAAIASTYMSSPLARALYEREKELGTLLPPFVRWMDGWITEAQQAPTEAVPR